MSPTIEPEITFGEFFRQPRKQWKASSLYLEPIRPDATNIWACGNCILFRSRRRGTMVAGAEGCYCNGSEAGRAIPPSEAVPYVLDYGLLEEGSGFERFRKAIASQLQLPASQMFFSDIFVDILLTPMENPEEKLGHDEFYLRILIEIVSEGTYVIRDGTKLKEGVNVSAMVLILDEYCGKDDEARGKKSHVRSYKKWKAKWKGHKDCRGIWIVLDFRVYYPTTKVGFWVHMGLPLVGYTEDMKRQAIYWENKVSNALSDHEKIVSDPKGLEERALRECCPSMSLIDKGGPRLPPTSPCETCV